MSQTIISGKGAAEKLSSVLKDLGINKFMLVCDSSFEFLNIKETIKAITIPYVCFSDFTPNPLYEDVVKGVELFKTEGCDAVVAVGGGSSLDTAKCIKLFCTMNPAENYLNQEFKENDIPLIALPTTAGTGSESTRYAVIYYEGKKQSVTHQSIVPSLAVLDPSVLTTLPLYQKKCTLLDALCQAIESWWSVNSTEESKLISKQAVLLIKDNMHDYLENAGDTACENIMTASNLAGQAISITQTTAAHAMSYKLTSLYKIPHGHAAAICLPKVWDYMLGNLNLCIDNRGQDYLKAVFEDIAHTLMCENPSAAVKWFEDMLISLEILSPKANDRIEELDILAKSVNPVRLGNNPVALSEDVLYSLYERIVK